jgi:nucleoside-diphosphate kinase
MEAKKNTFPEYVFVMIKPDGVERGLIGECFSRFERKGYRLLRINVGLIPEDRARKFYNEKSEIDCDFICSNPVVISVWIGESVIEGVRKICGESFKDVFPTLKGEFASNYHNDIIHSSESIEDAKREIDLFFPGLEN